MKINRWSSSLQMRIVTICIAISIVAVMIVSLILYTVISSIIREKVSTTTQGKLETLSATVDQRISSILSFMDSFVSNSSVNAALVSESWHYSNTESTLISTLFKTAILSNDNIIDSIIVYTDKGKFYAGGNGNTIVTKDVKERVMQLEKGERIRLWKLILEEKPTRHLNSENILSLYYVLRDTSSLERIGIVYVAISPERLMSTVENSSEGHPIVLVDEDMSVIYSNDSQPVGHTLVSNLSSGMQGDHGSFLFTDENGVRQFAIYDSTAINGWKLVEIIPYASLTSELDQYILYTIIIFSSALAFIILFSISGTRHIMSPLNRLKDSMVAVQHGNYDVELPVESKDEIGQLALTYNLMLTRIKQLIEEIYITEQKKRETELLVLQTQINPHFLYNTLNSIHWMAVVHGLNNISDMVNSLVAILRYSLNKFSTYTTLKIETDMLEPYLFIQNVRFSNGISFSSSIPKEFERCQIPRLLLQPLVENAISHGLRPMGGKGHIHINCTAENNRLLIDVTDNGVGLPEPVPEYTEYKKLKPMFPASSDELSIGLENTFNRIRLYFGNDYGLYFQSFAKKGTTVRVVLPISYAEEEDNP